MKKKNSKRDQSVNPFKFQNLTDLNDSYLNLNFLPKNIYIFIM